LSSTDLSALPILNAATDLVRRRAARLGAEPVPASPVTVVLDEAADLINDPASPARDLLTELLTTGRAVGVHVQARSRLSRQYATTAELDAAAEHGDL
jgi:hypothetical protein